MSEGLTAVRRELQPYLGEMPGNEEVVLQDTDGSYCIMQNACLSDNYSYYFDGTNLLKTIDGSLNISAQDQHRGKQGQFVMKRWPERAR